MSSQGFDTWVLEVRGAGLSMRGSDSKQVEKKANAISEKMEDVASSVANNVLPAINGASNGSAGVLESKHSHLEGDSMQTSTQLDVSELKTKFDDPSMRLSDWLSGFFNDGQLKVCPLIIYN